MEENKNVDTRKQELPAVHEVSDFFLYTTHVSPFIQEGDKEPSWDGSLYLYNSESRKQVDCYGKISVQVKGHMVDCIKDKQSISYDVRVSDLKAYLREGTAYFVVEIAGYKQSRIFYHLFHPIEIKAILAMKGGEKTRAIQFESMPIDFNVMDSKLIEFWTNCKKQISYVDSDILKFENLKDKKINKISFVAAGYDDKKHSGFIDFLSQKEMYIYAETDAEIHNAVPVGDSPVRFSFTQTIEEPVLANGTKYFDSYSNTISKDKITISVGGCFTMTFPKDLDASKISVTFKQTAKSLKEIINNCKFALDVFRSKSVTFGEQLIELESSDSKVIAELEDKLPLWDATQMTLDKLHVTTPFILSELKDEERETMDILISGILYNKPVLLEPPIDTHYIEIEVANLKLLLWAYKIEDNTYRIGDIFDGSITLTTKPDDAGNCYKTCVFSMLGVNGYLILDNINYNECVNLYKRVSEGNPEIFEFANMDLLAMIAAIDKLGPNTQKYKDTMRMAQSLAEWISTNDSDVNNQLNHRVNILQLKKRQNGLSNEEKQFLKQQLNNDCGAGMKAAISLLLDNQDMFELFYNQMNDEEQQIFLTYPICKWKTCN